VQIASRVVEEAVSVTRDRDHGKRQRHVL